MCAEPNDRETPTYQTEAIADQQAAVEAMLRAGWRIER
jgi:hypothetical protein